jgi:hypothetical protein
MTAPLLTHLGDTWARIRASYLLIPALMLVVSVGLSLGMIGVVQKVPFPGGS